MTLKEFQQTVGRSPSVVGTGSHSVRPNFQPRYVPRLLLSSFSWIRQSQFSIPLSQYYKELIAGSRFRQEFQYVHDDQFQWSLR